jgi:hypothetical protein
VLVQTRYRTHRAMTFLRRTLAARLVRDYGQLTVLDKWPGAAYALYTQKKNEIITQLGGRGSGLRRLGLKGCCTKHPCRLADPSDDLSPGRYG